MWYNCGKKKTNSKALLKERCSIYEGYVSEILLARSTDFQLISKTVDEKDILSYSSFENT